MAHTILLVDDSRTVLMIEKMMLRDLGYHVEVASDGETAIARALELKPSLIMLDVVMAGLSGTETCRRLKEDPETAEIPVIMVTTRSEPEIVNAAFEAGCDDYIYKPLKQQEVLAKLRVYLDD